MKKDLIYIGIKIGLSILIFFLTIGVSWFIGALAAWDASPANWDPAGRAFWFFIGGMGGVFTGTMFFSFVDFKDLFPIDDN